ncbi:DUF3014 domain-containing protein [Accumulibacter sp.]|uniref:DUF3014 domain-containing protein n=1 Tax=Accumulibacter sp. TaxID=2053492 RepID=UPI0028C500C4|nr:DUF3014 domain-containing protein [Accumulibacter sp.]
MSDSLRMLIAGLVLLVMAGSAYLWWQERQAPAPLPMVAPNTSAAEPAAPAEAPVHHAIEAITPPPEAALPPLTDTGSEVSDALIALLGRQQVLTFLDVSDFARRVVATLDNFGRSHAASRLWPVLPAPGRFSVIERDGATYMADSNMDRYKAFVGFASTINTGPAVDLYVRMYPLLQQAYVVLGYPDKYFNNRVVKVIDQLLATPELKEPAPLKLTEVQGPFEAPRPWVRYEYVDPALETLSAGQKILLRMGPENARQLKAKLREFRQRVAGNNAMG